MPRVSLCCGLCSGVGLRGWGPANFPEWRKVRQSWDLAGGTRLGDRPSPPETTSELCMWDSRNYLVKF